MWLHHLAKEEDFERNSSEHNLVEFYSYCFRLVALFIRTLWRNINLSLILDGGYVLRFGDIFLWPKNVQGITFSIGLPSIHDTFPISNLFSAHDTIAVICNESQCLVHG